MEPVTTNSVVLFDFAKHMSINVSVSWAAQRD